MCLQLVMCRRARVAPWATVLVCTRVHARVGVGVGAWLRGSTSIGRCKLMQPCRRGRCNALVACVPWLAATTLAHAGSSSAAIVTSCLFLLRRACWAADDVRPLLPAVPAIAGAMLEHVGVQTVAEHGVVCLRNLVQGAVNKVSLKLKALHVAAVKAGIPRQGSSHGVRVRHPPNRVGERGVGGGVDDEFSCLLLLRFIQSTPGSSMLLEPARGAPAAAHSCGSRVSVQLSFSLSRACVDSCVCSHHRPRSSLPCLALSRRWQPILPSRPLCRPPWHAS